MSFNILLITTNEKFARKFCACANKVFTDEGKKHATSPGNQTLIALSTYSYDLVLIHNVRLKKEDYTVIIRTPGINWKYLTSQDEKNLPGFLKNLLPADKTVTSSASSTPSASPLITTAEAKKILVTTPMKINIVPPGEHIPSPELEETTPAEDNGCCFNFKKLFRCG